MKCETCQYCQQFSYEIKGKQVNMACCTLSNYVVKADKEHNCTLHNKDLSGYDICYNCKYYRGGGDWGLFCSHKDMYHHLGKFSDDPCDYYEKIEL